MMNALEIVFWLISGLWLLVSVLSVWSWAGVKRLPDGDTAQAPARPPRVSVIIPARDEEARIETTVRRFLAQRDVDFEVIVVDDRSVDGTSEILGRIALAEPRLRVIRVDSLPEGWLGKCHACFVGAGQATGDWLLFADADVWVSDRILARALFAARSWSGVPRDPDSPFAGEGADRVVLIASFARSSYLAKAMLSASIVVFGFGAARVNRGSRRAYAGCGAFNLVRADVYRAIGGHETLRMEVLDDVKFGLLMAASGARSCVWFGGPEVEIAWGEDIRGIFTDLRKNAFAMLEFRTLRTVIASFSIIATCAAAILAPLSGSPAGFAAAAGYLSFAIPSALYSRRFGWSVFPALAAPFLFPLFGVAMLNSAAVVLRDGGVNWRGNFYPLADVRRGLVSWSGSRGRS